MDRRTFMISSAWFSATGSGCALPWFEQAAARRDTWAVVDPGAEAGRTFAVYAARQSLRIFETGDDIDIGLLWHRTLAPQLAAQLPTLLIGVTRASDYFVLSQFALRSGRTVQRLVKEGAEPTASVAFVIGPTAHG